MTAYYFALPFKGCHFWQPFLCSGWTVCHERMDAQEWRCSG